MLMAVATIVLGAAGNESGIRSDGNTCTLAAAVSDGGAPIVPACGCVANIKICCVRGGERGGLSCNICSHFCWYVDYVHKSWVGEVDWYVREAVGTLLAADVAGNGALDNTSGAEGSGVSETRVLNATGRLSMMMG